MDERKDGGATPAAGVAAARGGRGVRIALGISVALNLLVVGLVAGAVLRDGGPRERMVRDLDFGPFTEALEGYESFLGGIDRDMFEASPMSLTPEQFVQRVAQLEGQLLGLQSAIYQQFAASLGEYRQRALQAMIQSIGVFSVLTLLALYVLFCLNASIRRSTASIIKAAEGLRDGDLRVRMQVHGADDLANIAQALNTAVGQLRDSMQGVNQQSQQLGGTVQLLNGEARNALESVEQQQAQTANIAAANVELLNRLNALQAELQSLRRGDEELLW